MENQITIGTMITNGANKIRASFGDIQNIMMNAVENVMVIRIILVLASEMISSSWATSAERTDIRLPVCLLSKYDASISNSEFVASIRISCCAIYAVDCQS